MCPLAFCSFTAPCTDLSDSWPLPPRTLSSPFTVSAVTAACVPSTSMSVETPCRFNTIQAGAGVWYSTICVKPRQIGRGAGRGRGEVLGVAGSLKKKKKKKRAWSKETDKERIMMKQANVQLI